MSVPLPAATAAYDFRRALPLGNIGTGGSGLDLTANGTPTHTVGTGYTLNGTNQWLSDADDANYDVQAGEVITAYICATIPTLSGFPVLMSKRASGGATAASIPGWVFFTDSTGAVTARITNGTTIVSPARPAGSVVNGTRFVVALRIGASVCNLFVNGTKSTNQTRPTGDFGNAEEFRIGRLSGAAGASYLPGSVHMAAIHRTEHTDQQVADVSAWMLSPTSVGSAPRTLDLSVPTRTLDLTVPTRTLELSVPARTLEIST